MTGLQSLKRVKERLLEKVQPSFIKGPEHFGDARIMREMPRTAQAMEWNYIEFTRKFVRGL